MNIKNINIERENVRQNSDYKLKRTIAGIIVAGLIIGGTGIVQIPQVNNPKPIEQVVETQQEETTMKIEVEHPDVIDGEATIIIVDSRNVIITAPKVYPDGTIEDDFIDLYANEDYKILVKYNGEEHIIDFHIDEKTENGYKMTIDYETGNVNVSRNESAKTL